MTIRIGIIGYEHLHALKYAPEFSQSEDFELARISAPAENRDLARRDARRLGCEFRDGLGGFFKGLDAVYIGTSPEKHRRIIGTAIRSGVHVMCDKPLSNNLRDGASIRDMVGRSDIGFMVPFNTRFQPAVAKVGQSLGKERPRYIYATKFGLNPLNVRDADTSWFLDRRRAGHGGFFDIGMHMLDAMIWLMRDRPERVYARISREERLGGMDSLGIGSIEFEKGGTATLLSGWTKPFGSVPWLESRLEVLSSRGAHVIRKDLYEPVADFRIHDSKGCRPVGIRREGVSSNVSLFADVVRGRKRSVLDVDNAFLLLKTLVRMYESSSKNRIIRL